MPLCPVLTTERLILRPFTANDIDAIFTLYSDEKTNTFLPWFPIKARQEAEDLFARRYAAPPPDGGYRYAVCLRTDDIPIGYVHLSESDSRDIGYGLRSDCWGRGIAAEAAAAVICQAQKDGIPFVTATHDVRNPASGRVMQKLGLRYCYSYVEQWQPKNIPVTFRLYQRNLDGCEKRMYTKYWEQSAIHYVE